MNTSSVPSCAAVSADLLTCEYLRKGLCDANAGSRPLFAWLNYLEIHYCVMEHQSGLSIVIMLAYLFLLMYVVWVAAENHFCPTVSQISALFKIKGDLAGVTLVALSNSASEMFGTISAVQQGAVSVALGELLGSSAILLTVGLFIIVVVVGPRRVVRVDGNSLTRDTFVCVVALTFCMYIMADTRIVRVEPVVCLLMYAAYVVFCVVFTRYVRPTSEPDERRRHPQHIRLNDSRSERAGHSPAHSSDDSELRQEARVREFFAKRGLPYDTDREITLWEHPDRANAFEVEDAATTADAQDPYSEDEDLSQEILHNVYRNSPELQQCWRALQRSICCFLWNRSARHRNEFEHSLGHQTWGEWWKSKQLYFRNVTDWDTRSRVSKVVFVATLPLTLGFYLTVPSTTHDRFDRDVASITPLFASFFIVVYTQAWHLHYQETAAGVLGFPFWILIPVSGVCLSLILFVMLRILSPSHWFLVRLILSALSLTIVIMWIHFLSHEIVAVTITLSHAVHLPNYITSLTLLSFGSCIGDLIANTMLAKHDPQVAVSAIYGSVIFNFLVSLPVGFLATPETTLQQHIGYGSATITRTIHLAFVGIRLDMDVLFAFLFLIGLLFFVWFLSKCVDYEWKRIPMAWIFFLAYPVFLGISIYLFLL